MWFASHAPRPSLPVRAAPHARRDHCDPRRVCACSRWLQPAAHASSPSLYARLRSLSLLRRPHALQQHARSGRRRSGSRCRCGCSPGCGRSGHLARSRVPSALAPPLLDVSSQTQIRCALPPEVVASVARKVAMTTILAPTAKRIPLPQTASSPTRLTPARWRTHRRHRTYLCPFTRGCKAHRPPLSKRQ